MFGVISDVASNLVTNGISKLVLGNDKVARTEKLESEETKTAEDSGFDSVLQSFLPADSNASVSEEDLFAAAAGERVNSLKGEEGLAAYRAALDAEKAAVAGPDGYVPMEKAALNALKKLVADGVLTSEEGDRVFTESFSAAQLDGNKEALFDGKGGANDPTMAVAKMSEAMAAIKAFIEGNTASPIPAEQLKSLATSNQTGAGASTAGLNLLSAGDGTSDSGHVVPNGTYVDGSEGFLFKPVTNNEGNLAVMFAQSWTNNIAGVRMLDSAGNLLENGVRKPEGISETGREKFTFSKKGGEYPRDVTVEVAFHDGSIKTYQIADPSKRYD